MRWNCTLFAAALVTTVSSAAAHAETPAAETVERGRLIYEAGRLASGELLSADRGGGIVSTGVAAACINCHQRSGHGLFEATNLVPPVTGPALFANERPKAEEPRRAKGMKHQEFPFLTRPAYDAESLARAVREGVSPSGYHFQYLMPRYALGDADMSALTAYLRQLSAIPSPGVDPSSAHFATVIAPGQDGSRRQAVVDTLKACFEEKHPSAGPGQAWHLHVWDLAGPPESWRGQLEAKYAAEPVFALVSGLGSDEWEPVHRFAEEARLPLLFPNIDVAASAKEGIYSFYFSKGVMLEAEVIARYLADHAGETGLGRIVQVRPEGGAGFKAAHALRAAVAPQVSVEDRVLAQARVGDWQAVLSGLTPSDALVLWLEGGQLSALGNVPPPNAGRIVFSGWLAGLDAAPIPPAWKALALMTYPVDAPQRREARMEFNLRPWLKKQNIAHPDEILLGNSLTACNLLTEGMLRMRGSYFRDYLVELTEHYPAGMGNAPAPEAFPRFVIGPGQRYSSKGAYIVRFKPGQDELELVQDWIVPE